MMLQTNFDRYRPWSGAVNTFERIREENKLDELEFMLEELYPEGITETQLNDLLWFDSEWVFEQLGIQEDEEEDEE